MSRDIQRATRRAKNQSSADDNTGNLVFNFNSNLDLTLKFDGGSPSSALPASLVPKDVFVFGDTSPSKPTLQKSFTDIAPDSPVFESSDEFQRANSAPNKSATPYTFGTGTKANDTCTAESDFGSTPAYTTAPTKNTTSLTALKKPSTNPTAGTSSLSRRSEPALPPATTTQMLLSQPFTLQAPASPILSFELPLVQTTPTTSTIPVTYTAGSTTAVSFGTRATCETTSTNAVPTITPPTSLFSFNVATQSNTGTTTAAALSDPSTNLFGDKPSPAPKPVAPTLAFDSSTTAAKKPTPTLTKKSCSSKESGASASLLSSSAALCSLTSTPTTLDPSLFPFGPAPVTSVAMLTTPSTTTTTAEATFSSLPSSSVTLDHTTAPETPSPFLQGSAPSTSAPSLLTFGSTFTTSAAVSPTPITRVTTAAVTSSNLPSSSVTPDSSAAPVATSAAPNAFTFSTVLSNMSQGVDPTPTQFNVALITPAVSASSQDQITASTDFCIDNILPVTRYTELPEQAQNELDQLNQYIQNESQRYQYILKRMSSKPQESIGQVKHDQQIMSYKLNALASSLQMQVNAMEQLFESLTHQIQCFIDGQKVIDEYKHPGTQTHQEHSLNIDDYFVQLSTQLMTRLEQYKKCIQDIEAKLNSWTKNKVQSPQDIARAMTSLNQACLALAEKVAALHEQLDMEQDLYLQHKLQSVTL